MTVLSRILGIFLFLIFSFAPQYSVSQPPEVYTGNASLRDDLLSLDDGIDSMSTGAVKKREETFQYCLNIFDEAKEVRNAVMTKRLKEIEAEVDKKLDEMEIRIAQLKSWTERREKFLEQANDSLVEIFKTMRADAAALQMTEIGPAIAASIISKLGPKQSSAILAEMKPDDAAKITMVLTNIVVMNDKS